MRTFLSYSDRNLCAVVVRRAGFRVESLSVDLAIEQILSGQAPRCDWEQCLADFLKLFCPEDTIDE
jgi:hypothetical protein